METFIPATGLVHGQGGSEKAQNRSFGSFGLASFLRMESQGTMFHMERQNIDSQ